MGGGLPHVDAKCPSGWVEGAGEPNAANQELMIVVNGDTDMDAVGVRNDEPRWKALVTHHPQICKLDPSGWILCKKRRANAMATGAAQKKATTTGGRQWRVVAWVAKLGKRSCHLALTGGYGAERA
uniref:Uncharacterized protein n=1 Tax=Anopheles coluzzii TaxID=1518534 RepID=A0A8W7PTG9_ANOCL